MENQTNSRLRVISGELVDLIEPYPTAHIKRVWGWIKRFKNLALSDETPKRRKEFTDWLKNGLANSRSFGIVDREDRLGKGSPTLIGIIIYEPFSTTNGFLHIATNMSAYGKRFADEAGKLLIEDLFTNPSVLSPNLTRLSAYSPTDNWMAKKLLERVGFSKEGEVADMYTYNGEPISCSLYGLTRRNWTLWDSQRTSQKSEQASFQAEASQWMSLEQPSELSEAEDDRVDKAPIASQTLAEAETLTT